MAKASVSKASTHWEGSLFKGKGQTSLDTVDVNLVGSVVGRVC